MKSTTVIRIVGYWFAALVAAILIYHLIPFTWGIWGEKEPEPETPTTALVSQLEQGYLLEQDLQTQQQVLWRYYNINDSMSNHNDGEGNAWIKPIMHSSELRFLPEFAANETPDWEEVSRYLCDFAVLTEGQYRFGETSAAHWSYDDMAAVCDILLPSAKVERQNSGWLNYIASDDWYEAVGWDSNGMVYYVLTEPLTCEDGVYTAHFAGYAVGEMSFEDDDYGKNYNDRVMYEIWQHSGEDRAYFIENILMGELLAENLVRAENLTVTFTLSGDEVLPLSYHSCERKELMSN